MVGLSGCHQCSVWRPHVLVYTIYACGVYRCSGSIVEEMIWRRSVYLQHALDSERSCNELGLWHEKKVDTSGLHWCPKIKWLQVYESIVPLLIPRWNTIRFDNLTAVLIPSKYCMHVSNGILNAQERRRAEEDPAIWSSLGSWLQVPQHSGGKAIYRLVRWIAISSPTYCIAIYRLVRWIAISSPTYYVEIEFLI